MQRLRQAMLAHPDGERVVAAAHMSPSVGGPLRAGRGLARRPMGAAARGTNECALLREVHHRTCARGAVTSTGGGSDRWLRPRAVRPVASDDAYSGLPPAWRPWRAAASIPCRD